MLELVEDPSRPLLERVRLCSIVSATLDAVAAVALSDAASAPVIAPAFRRAVAAVGRIPAARLKANQASTLCSVET